jgi:hypothetical protein
MSVQVKVPRAILQRLEKSDALAAFAYGSKIEGISNTSSDLDICEITLSRSNSEMVGPFESEEVVHIESVPENELREVYKKALTRPNDDYSVTWCHRLLVGLQILDDRNILSNLRDSIVLEPLVSVLVNYYVGAAITYANDCIGALESGDNETAILSARLGVDAASLAHLASKNSINPNRKWIFRYLRKTKSEHIAMLYARLLKTCSGSQQELKIFTEDSLKFINTTIQLAQNPI